MKQHLLIIMLFVASHGYAQQWAPLGATWYYSYNNFWISGYVKIESVGDTVIDDAEYRVLQKTYFLYNYFDSTFSESKIGQEFTRQDGKKVMVLKNNQLYTLFDFGAQPGDWWLIPGTYSASNDCDTVGYVQVDSIGMININGVNLRQLYITSMNNSDWGWGPFGHDVLTEKIGNQSSYLLPELISGCIVDLFEGGPFRCYEDDEIGLYSVLTQGYCDSITGIYEPEHDLYLSVYPNPFTTITTLSYTLDESENVQFTVYNVQGQIVYTIQENRDKGKQQMQWNAEGLPAGMYYFRIQAGSYIGSGKMILLD